MKKLLTILIISTMFLIPCIVQANPAIPSIKIGELQFSPVDAITEEHICIPFTFGSSLAEHGIFNFSKRSTFPYFEEGDELIISLSFDETVPALSEKLSEKLNFSIQYTYYNQLFYVKLGENAEIFEVKTSELSAITTYPSYTYRYSPSASAKIVGNVHFSGSIWNLGKLGVYRRYTSGNYSSGTLLAPQQKTTIEYYVPWESYFVIIVIAIVGFAFGFMFYWLVIDERRKFTFNREQSKEGGEN